MSATEKIMDRLGLSQLSGDPKRRDIVRRFFMVTGGDAFSKRKSEGSTLSDYKDGGSLFLFLEPGSRKAARYFATVLRAMR
jgi:hypothetical protein